MKILKQFAIIAVISFIAEGMSVVIPFPIPAGIYGMFILFLLLNMKVIRLEQVSTAGEFLIAIMGVMFIPAGVGLMNHFESLASMLPAIIVAIAIITPIVMVVSGKVTQYFYKKEK